MTRADAPRLFAWVIGMLSLADGKTLLAALLADMKPYVLTYGPYVGAAAMLRLGFDFAWKRRGALKRRAKAPKTKPQFVETILPAPKAGHGEAVELPEFCKRVMGGNDPGRR